MKNFFFLLATCCLVVSCSTKPADGSMPETLNIINEDFREHRLEYEVLPVEITDYVGSIQIDGDIAYFGNIAGDEIVSVYDLKNNRRIGSAINKGRGHNELLASGWKIQINKDKKFASIYDLGQKTFMIFPLEVLTRVANGDTNRVFTPFAKFTMENSNMDMYALDTEIFVSVKGVNATKRLGFYDRQGNMTAEKGVFYRTPEMTFPESINWHAFDGKL